MIINIIKMSSIGDESSSCGAPRAHCGPSGHTAEPPPLAVMPTMMPPPRFLMLVGPRAPTTVRGRRAGAFTEIFKSKESLMLALHWTHQEARC
jgi:hypothetical protein